MMAWDLILSWGFYIAWSSFPGSLSKYIVNPLKADATLDDVAVSLYTRSEANIIQNFLFGFAKNIHTQDDEKIGTNKNEKSMSR